MTARQRGKCRRPESAPYSAPARSSRPAQARAGTCLRLAAVAMQARGTQPNILHKVGPSRPRRPEALYTASSPPARSCLPGRSPAPAGPPRARAREREPVEPKTLPPSAAPVAVRPRDAKSILTRRPSRRQGAHCASEHDSPPPPPRRPLATRRRKSRGHGRFEQPGVSVTDDSDAVADRPAVPGQSRTPAWPRACPPRPRGLRRARRRRRRLGRSHAPGPLFRPSARFETLLPLPWPG